MSRATDRMLSQHAKLLAQQIITAIEAEGPAAPGDRTGDYDAIRWAQMQRDIAIIRRVTS